MAVPALWATVLSLKLHRSPAAWFAALVRHEGPGSDQIRGARSPAPRARSCGSAPRPSLGKKLFQDHSGDRGIFYIENMPLSRCASSASICEAKGLRPKGTDLSIDAMGEHWHW